MTTSSSAYTPLEALLLFQYLRSHGVASAAFNKISDLLRQDEQIRNGSSFDVGRLSPDALREFFARLLKEEARSEAQALSAGGDGHDGQNGDVPPGSKKRKARSPSLPNTQEAFSSGNENLIPILIQKLYARYREHAIIEIREEERRYSHLKQEYADIKAGKWDARFQKDLEREQAAKQQKEVLNAAKVESTKSPVNAGPSMPSAAEPPSVQHPTKDQRHNTPPHPVPSQIIPPQLRPPNHPPPTLHQPPSISPRPTPSQPNGPTYQVKSPALHPSPYSQQQTPAATTSPQDAAPQNRPTPVPGMPPPPVPGATYPSHPMPPYPPYANNTQQSPRFLNQSPYPPPPPQGSPIGMQQYTAPQPPYLPQAPQAPQAGKSPNRGGVMLQPFTVSAQKPTGVRQQPLPIAPNQATNRPLFATPVTGPGTPSTPNASIARPIQFSPYDIAKLLATPAPVGSATSRLSGSPWNASGRSSNLARQGSPPRPSARSVSPLSDHAPSPVPEAAVATRSVRTGKQPLASESGSQASRRLPARRGRGGSTTSSVLGGSARGRTRSQSVISHAEDVSMLDNESVSGRGVKNEPSTPADVFDQVQATIESTPSSGGPAGSTRRAAIQSNMNKRKRGPRDTSESSDTVLPHPRQDKSVVLAMRKFPLQTSSVMNDILSHKHASLFGAPVRERDAEGYTSMIRRPQDLKSIRAAIAAGAKAVNAATADSASTAPTSSPRDAGGSVLLPVSEDIIPPRGIVNSSQLEKEVMRMFTNAVMFNPGEEDVVQDAREMFEDVQQHVSNFRSLESRKVPGGGVGLGRGRSEVETVEEEDGGGSGSVIGKRRRL
ncbi:hypothetical protein EJ08DRAFT_160142 [Tothia fuscella]|uniref:Bromo domain-containing protein n=1 Tax=Tothia fuscella TaxID=1048955 RepID=A0A9P4NVK0_9PEZI|nr:hypothetical protein EJ08DRAFT_160142 [Tothia fuscella]